ncbi:MAG: radical SAM protein [Thermodesulfobacteriota bacterium]|nr:radical SAM protein [Thermodesulfobacteriota bacterium]
MTGIETAVEVNTSIDHNFHLIANKKIELWESTRSQQYREYRRKWEEYPKNHFVAPFPIHLDIEATNACNLKCVMCPRPEMVESGTFWKIQMFDLDTYKRIIQEGVEYGLCSVKYNFMGEPTLNPNLIQMIEYAKQAGVIDVMFNTNATLLDENLSRQLIISGLDKLFFSFDSPYRDRYNAIRVGADFDRVLHNIIRFMVIRDEMGSITPFTRASMVLMKENEEDWTAFRELLEPIVDAVASVDYLDQGGLNNPERTVVPLGARKGRFCCPQLWQRMVVHPDGVVTICCIDALRVMNMGNIFHESIRDIWLSDTYEELRDKHINGRIDDIPLCAGCALAKY